VLSVAAEVLLVGPILAALTRADLRVPQEARMFDPTRGVMVPESEVTTGVAPTRDAQQTLEDQLRLQEHTRLVRVSGPIRQRRGGPPLIVGRAVIRQLQALGAARQ
jgi:hypothetical protein